MVRPTRAMVLTKGETLARDPEFRSLLGPEFDHLDDDELELVLDAILDTIRERVEELERTFPVIPGLSISV